MHFQGGQLISLDKQNRLAIPTRYRDSLTAVCQGLLTLTRHPDGCLVLYPRPVWIQLRDKLAAMPLGARDWVRMYVGDADDLEMDSAGRILISPTLKALGGLDREISFKGMIDGFELWHPEKLHQREQSAITAGMPDYIAQMKL